MVQTTIQDRMVNHANDGRGWFYKLIHDIASFSNVEGIEKV